MIKLTTVLSELLFDHDTVIVPGLGMFMRHDDSAKVNVITNHFESPSSTLGFDPRQREENELLAKTLELREGCTAEEARQTASRFVSDCFDAFKEGRQVTLPGIGVLFMDDHETVCFEQEQGMNYNSDAFGLGDFDPKPVHVSRATVTVDEKKGSKDNSYGESDYDRRSRRAIVFSLLTLLLAIPVVALLLHFMEIIHLDRLFSHKPVTPVTVYVPRDTSLNRYWVRYDFFPEQVPDDISAEDSIPDLDTILLPDTISVLNTIPDQEVASSSDVVPSVDTPIPEKPLKFSIIGGCFSQQENAENLVASLLKEGYSKAEVMPRGRQYYVCYGRFATLEEAKAALAEIRQNSNSKAWILNK